MATDNISSEISRTSSDSSTIGEPSSLFDNIADGGMRRPGALSQGRKRNFLIFLALNLITLTHAFESTCLCVTLPIIAVELNASVAETLSLSSVFLLGMTLAQPFSSEMSWLYGRRPVLLSAILLFAAGTIVCGCAQSPLVLLIGRCIQGVGAGATEPVKALVLFDLFDLRERSKWMAYLNVSWALGTISGPLLGGVFARDISASWRWVFWINLPLLGMSFLGAACLLGYDKRKAPSWKALMRLDWGGLVFFATSGWLLLVSLSLAGSTYPWKSVPIIGGLLLGVFGVMILGFHEAQVASRPIFKPRIFKKGSASILLLSVLIHGLLMWMILYYMALYYAGVRGGTPLQTGIMALPATLTVAPMAMVVGFVVSKTGHYQGFLHGGWLCTMVTFVCLYFFEADVPLGGLIGVSLLAGLSFGSLIPGMSVGIQATVDKELSGDAICMTLLARPAGQTLGIAIGLTVFSTVLEKELRGSGLDHGTGKDMIKMMVSHSAEGQLGGEAREVVTKAAMQALRTIWTVGIGLAGMSLLLTSLAKLPRLREDQAVQRQRGDEEALEMD